MVLHVPNPRVWGQWGAVGLSGDRAEPPVLVPMSHRGEVGALGRAAPALSAVLGKPFGFGACCSWGDAADVDPQ